METLTTRNLKIGYSRGKGGDYIVHDGLSLTLHTGRVTCLLGLNGAGKSTLIRTLCGFSRPLAGEVLLYGKPLTGYSQSEIASLIGVVLTDKTNAGGLSVYELVSLGRYPHTGFLGRLSEEDHSVIASSLEDVGIAHKAQCHISELSDGERQKVFIAKALAQECPVMILDEPTAFLDVVSRMEIMALLRNLSRTKDKSILLSTHDLDSALQMGDELWLMEKGGDFVCGEPSELVTDGSLERFFSRGSVRFDSASRRLACSDSAE